MNISISENLQAPTVIFISGWPDTCDVFRNNIQRVLANDYRIVGITIPGFNHDHPFFRKHSRSFSSLSSQVERRYVESTISDKEDKTCSPSTKSSVPFWRRFLTHMHSCIPISEALPRPTTEADDNKKGQTSLNTCHAYHSSAPLFKCAKGTTCAASVERHPHRDSTTTLRARKDVPMWTPHFGYSFQDLVNLLEIAVDTAMENHNYCQRDFISTILDVKDGAMRTQGVPLHQLPQHYPKPILIAHDWGCLLAYELLLARPGLFSRIIALDTGLRIPNSILERIPRPIGRPCPVRPVSKSNPDCAPFRVESSRAEEARVNQISKAPSLAPLAMHRSSLQAVSYAPSCKVNREVDTCIFGLANAQSNSPDTSSLSPLEGLTTSSSEIRTFTSCRKPPNLESHSVETLLSKNVSVGTLSCKLSRASTTWQAAQSPKERVTPFQRWLQRIVGFIRQLIIILCGLILPVALARWVLCILLSLSNRPRYSYDPRYQFSPLTESSFQCSAQFQDTQHCLPTSGGYHEVKRPLKSDETSVGLQLKLRLWISSFLHGAPPLCPDFDSSDHALSNDYSLQNGFPSPYVHKDCGRNANDSGVELSGAESSWCIFMVPFLASDKQNHSSHAALPPCQQSSRDNLFPVARAMGSLLHAHDRKTNPVDQGISSSRGPTCDLRTANSGDSKLWTVFAGYALAKAENGSSRGVWDALSGVNPYCAYRNHWCAEDSYQGNRGYVNFRDPTHKTNGVNPWASSCLCSLPNSATESTDLFKKKFFYYKSYFFPPLGSCLTEENAEKMPAKEEEHSAAACFYLSQHKGSFGHGEGAGAATTVGMKNSSNAMAHKKNVYNLKDVNVHANPETYWIYLRYWISTLKAWVFSPRRMQVSGPFQSEPTLKESNTAPKKSSTRRYMRTFDKDEGTRGKGSAPDILPCTERMGFSPLVSESFFSPIPIPILFMYGANKSVMQHSPEWCEYITSVKRVEDGISNVIKIDRGGHWFFAEPDHREKVAKYVLDFIKTPIK